MNPLHYTVQGPAFNYMVPTPHAYIMGDSIGYGGNVVTDFLGKAIKKFSPITSPVQLQDVVQASKFTIEQERSAKGLTTYTDAVKEKIDELYEKAAQATTREQVQGVLGELRVLARDSEAPITRMTLGNIQIGEEFGANAGPSQLTTYLKWGGMGIAVILLGWGISKGLRR